MTSKADTHEAAPPKGAAAEPHNYRLAVDPHGAHGYEVGFWPSGGDLNDPAAFVVVAKCYTQAEAQALATHYDANPPDHLPPEESGPGGGRGAARADEEPHATQQARHHRK
jgi:hypothetical protein